MSFFEGILQLCEVQNCCHGRGRQSRKIVSSVSQAIAKVLPQYFDTTTSLNVVGLNKNVGFYTLEFV